MSSQTVPTDGMRAMAAAGLIRRLAAAFYDALLLIALWLLTTGLWLLALHGQAIRPGTPLYHPFQLSLLLVAFAFFAGFWTRAGATLGMQAWRLRVIRADGGRLRWHDAAKRFLAAILAWLPLGLGLFWLLVDRDRLAWQDRLTGTRIVVVRRQNS